MMMIVVTVVTMALNGLAAAWQLGLITHLPMSPCQRTAVRESEWKPTSNKCPPSCHARFLSADLCRLTVLCALVCVTPGVSVFVCCLCILKHVLVTFSRVSVSSSGRRSVLRVTSAAVTVAARCLQLVATLPLCDVTWWSPRMFRHPNIRNVIFFDYVRYAKHFPLM